ncbi:OprO/OprP family phosphate-selective porin [Chiayiivirga flava]|uniref:Phosphate-selective porin OprO/OprP n=1 Tax=Chiayiivirga flava TaxID=659595 RepID=A0A7W8D339_9GAMM|nr:porin [Chiayiivirga flava]MBB5207055.1 phosphate-selective porin OprO/OprP [Chiayiivirga flava]
MLSRRLVLAACILAAPAAPASAEIVFDVIGGSEVSLEGLLQADGNWYDSDVADLNGSGNNGDDSEFELRRAEVVVKGKGPGNVEWVVGYDAKADKFLDTNVRYKWGAYTGITVGQAKQPNSLEELTSTRFNDFIAKASATNTFGIARRLGVQLATGDENWSLTGGMFGRELTRNLAHGSGFGLRGTFAPLNRPGSFLHLGLSAVDVDTDNDTARPRARPLADLATVRLVDTGDITDADRQRTYGAEAAWVSGPVKLQGEYMQSTISRLAHSDFSGDSAYVYALWNITGETWTYRNGLISTALPDNPTTGLWQVGLRYDTIDLDDGSVQGGEMDSVTLGANVYLRSNFKLALNYVQAQSTRRGIDDDPGIVEARAQLHW